MTSGNSPNCVGLDANLEDNVREYANLNKPFLDSIAEHGVLQPITAIRRADGVVEVRNGQRRTMAARKLGLSSIPVYVGPATAADAAAETIERIVHQGGRRQGRRRIPPDPPGWCRLRAGSAVRRAPRSPRTGARPRAVGGGDNGLRSQPEVGRVVGQRVAVHGAGTDPGRVTGRRNQRVAPTRSAQPASAHRDLPPAPFFRAIGWRSSELNNPIGAARMCSDLVTVFVRG
jgi:ParB/Sulfiredoxin domain